MNPEGVIRNRMDVKFINRVRFDNCCFEKTPSYNLSKWHYFLVVMLFWSGFNYLF